MARVSLLTLLVALPALAAPVTFNIDSAKSELLAFTTPTGVFKGASHSHVIKADKISGKIVYDADSLESSWVQVSFPVSAMTVDDPELRKREGMTSMLSDRDREAILKAMRSPRQLDEKRFAQISFDSTKVTKKDAGKLEVTGRLGIHGVRKSITLLVSYSIADGQFRGEAAFTFTHKDFGIPTITAVMGTVRNAEPIRLKILLVGASRDAPDDTLENAGPADAGK